MSKRLLSTALAAVIAVAAFAPAAQAASTGTINFTGKVLADTCTISVNGGNTVNLPTVMTAAFGTAAGVAAGATHFTVALSGCDANTASANMAFSGSNVDAATGNLNNAASNGSNVQIQLLNASDAVINTFNQGNAPSITVTNGAGSTQMTARYISTDAVTTAGLVSSTVDFTLTYL